MYRDFVVRQKRDRLIRLFLTSLVFVVIGCFMLQSPSSQDIFFGWLSTCFFGLCLVVFSIQLIRGTTLLTVNENEIIGYHRGFFRKRIALQSIVRSKVGMAGFVPYVQVYYDNNCEVKQAYFPLFSAKTTPEELMDALQVLNELP